MTSESGQAHSAASTLVKTAIQIVVSLAIMAVLMFWPAGTLSWALGWWFLGVFTLMVLIAVAYMWRVNPDLFEARQGFKPGSKSWDVVVASVLMAAIAAILPVAGFDYHFQWLQAPGWLVGLGYVLFIGGFLLAGWAESVNRYFEMGVRIQTDRGHTVIDSGPYARIRHPGYSGAIVLSVGVALALGSVVALAPVVVVILILAYRTLREEQTLGNELPGYAAYMDRVRYRWAPGVW
jgi:protein-S-isoprenylcysteine O-methyltransferase Ste14